MQHDTLCSSPAAFTSNVALETVTHLDISTKESTAIGDQDIQRNFEYAGYKISVVFTLIPLPPEGADRTLGTSRVKLRYLIMFIAALTVMGSA